MKFAVNYSPEAADLLRAGYIRLDRFKCPDWDDLIATAQADTPVYVHFPLIAGQGTPGAEYLDRVAQLMALTGTPHVNTHFAPTFRDLPDHYTVDDVVAVALRDLAPLVEGFGADNVMVENIPYPERRRDKPLEIALPEVITRVIEESGARLLLDLGHARRAAEHLALDPRRYIDALPTHRLKELHITGLGYDPDGHRTDHLPMREDDWELFAWALDHIRARRWGEPWIVSCEYGGVGEVFRWRSDRVVLAEQLPRMAEMVYSAQPAPVP